MKYLLKIIKAFGVFLINLICGLVSLLVPKRKGLIIISGWFADRFADNTKFLYLQNYRKLDKPALNLVWIAGTEEIYQQLRNESLPVVKKNSLKSVWLHLRAECHIVDQSHRSLLGFLSVRAKRINLWHGIGVKRTYFVEPPQNNSNAITKLMYKWYLWLKMHTSGWISVGRWDKQYLLEPSKFSGNAILAHCFPDVLNTRFLCTYPRDVYVNDMINGVKDYNLLNTTETKDYAKMQKLKSKGYKLVFYLPTFRNNNLMFLGTEDHKQIDEFFKRLSKEKIVIVFKMHAFDKTPMSKCANCVNLDGSADLTSFLFFADALITDYSSAYTDFLRLDRPEIFYIFDFDKYKNNDRGFLVDYDTFTPGKKVYDLEELGDYILKLSKDNFKDQYSQQRAEVLGKLYGSKIIDPIKTIRGLL